MYKNALEKGGLAVVTGAASGVGKVAALRFAQSGLGVVLADLPGDALESAAREIAQAADKGVPVLMVPTDVSDADAVAALSEAAFAAGEVAVLMNNAGVGPLTSSWSQPEVWRKLIEINLFGVINGVQSFLPRMISADRPAVVINTGSKQGITTPPGNPAYNVTKAGVKVLSEMLAHDLRAAGAPITAHLFVPGFTYTGLTAQHFPKKPEAAWSSEQTVDYFIGRMAAGDFYVLCPDNDVSADLDRRRAAWSVGDIIENRPALSRWHSDFKDAYATHEKG